jgi:hypothetical protein
MWNKPLTLFIGGIIIGALITDLEAFLDPNHPNDVVNFLIFAVSFGGVLANISYHVILIVILPFVAVPKLKEKLGPKSLQAYVFVAGITFWGAADGLYIILFV